MLIIVTSHGHCETSPDSVPSRTGPRSIEVCPPLGLPCSATQTVRESFGGMPVAPLTDTRTEVAPAGKVAGVAADDDPRAAATASGEDSGPVPSVHCTTLANRCGWTASRTAPLPPFSTIWSTAAALTPLG